MVPGAPSIARLRSPNPLLPAAAPPSTAVSVRYVVFFDRFFNFPYFCRSLLFRRTETGSYLQLLVFGVLIIYVLISCPASFLSLITENRVYLAWQTVSFSVYLCFNFEEMLGLSAGNLLKMIWWSFYDNYVNH